MHKFDSSTNKNALQELHNVLTNSSSLNVP